MRLARVGVIGLGRAGGALVASLERAGVHVEGVRRAAHLKGPRAQDLDAIFLAVPDDAIAAVAAELARRRALPALVVHLAGSQGTSALDVLPAAVARGVFHPLASLDGKSPIPEGTLIAWDATSTGAARALAALARRIGAHPARVTDENRARYHAGAVVAGNLPVALLHAGVRLLVDAGVPPDLARVSLARLLRTQAENAARKPLAQALTGPVARGDALTVRRHLDVIGADDAIASLYRALSRILVEEVAAHPAPTRAALRDALKARPHRRSPGRRRRP